MLILCVIAFLEDLGKLNMDKEAMPQWINENSNLECYEYLSDNDTVSRVACGLERNRDFFLKCPENAEENPLTHKY